MTRVLSTLILLSFLASCGSLGRSRLNPANWFGKSKSRAVVQLDKTRVKDTTPLVDTVLSLRVDRAPGGAIIHAMGLPPTQGYWNAKLKPENGEKPQNGMLSYTFRLLPPDSAAPQGTKRSREVLVGRFISSQKLAGVRRIRVIGVRNRRTVRR